MSEKQEDIFSKIDTEKARKRIYQYLTELDIEIQIQLKETIVKVRSFKELDGNLVIFRNLIEMGQKEDVIVSFTIEPDRYFLHSSIHQKDMNAILYLTDALYKLQRRKNFRMSIPAKWEGVARFINFVPDQFSSEYILNDLSTGGFSVLIPFSVSQTVKLQTGMKINGHLYIEGRLDFHFKAILRHSRQVGTKLNPQMRLGLEFDNLPTGDENTIQSLLMQVHREVFAKLRGK